MTSVHAHAKGGSSMENDETISGPQEVGPDRDGNEKEPIYGTSTTKIRRVAHRTVPKRNVRLTLYITQAVDLTALLVSWFAARLILGDYWPSWVVTPDATQTTRVSIISAVPFVALYVIALWINKSYRWHTRLDVHRSTRLVVRSCVYAASFLFAIGVMFHGYLLTITLPLASSLAVVFLLIGRGISAAVCRRVLERNPVKLLVVGTASGVSHVLGDDLEARFPLHEIAGVMISDGINAPLLREEKEVPVTTYSTVVDIADKVLDGDFDAVWLASLDDLRDRDIRRVMWLLEGTDVRVYVDPMIGGIEGHRVKHERVGTRTAIQLRKPKFNRVNGFVKRAMDIIGSAVILTLISPILLITAIAIKLDDGGPIFYKSTRVGLRGEPFQMWKFRSMRVDADQIREKLAKEQGQSAFLFKMKDDPRVTRVGKFIRKTSIDELPQFFNTFNGTMSIVGPRPALANEVDMYSPDMRMRLEVKPGITGLWQVNGRSDLSAEEAENLDLYYVDNWTIWMDFTIFFKTFSAVLLSRGAY
ncbi:putative sugar transferase EpsL [Corynebacterium glaucum]|uniref:Putative sugar transferase EpsL n=1 Tax=Corynebacterium glaucum TaxID=187491 RepID=A0A1Q2HWB7_9CORY|nr:sugar transferase [Corynebacterium glaucum]AQQ15080.1 putative sugar transferase EpsL [Corynebacterium glaucum]